MFFFGIMGVNVRVSEAGTLHVPHCPVCNGTSPLHVARRYQTFHVFFLPLIPFNSHYMATCPGCAGVFEIPNEIGELARKNGSAYAAAEDLVLVRGRFHRICPVCQTALDEGDRFCRRCGTPL